MVKAGVFLLLASSLFGCALRPAERDPFDVFPEKFREEALHYEKSGCYPEALLSWKVVAGLSPEDDEAAKHLLLLQTRLQKEADRNFQKGVAFFRKNRRGEARVAFLRTLYLDNSHLQALGYLKNRLTPAHTRVVVAKSGDTLRGIAAVHYRDAEKAFLLAEFNAFDLNDPLAPGTEIKLPVLVPLKTAGAIKSPLSYTEEKKPTQKPQAEARKTKEADVEKPSSNSEKKAVDGTPENTKGKRVIDKLIYNKGKTLLGEKKYRKAFDVLSKLDEGYKNVRQINAFLKRYMKREAEKHYSRGIEYFAAEKLQQAMGEWRQTLSLNPDHQKALNDLERAEKLQNRLNGL